MTAEIIDLAATSRFARSAAGEDRVLALLRDLALKADDAAWSLTAYDRGCHTRLITAGPYEAAEVKVVAGARYVGHRGVILGISPSSWRYQVLLECGARRLFLLPQLELVWRPPYAGQVRQDPPPDDPGPAA